jgi:DNA-binding response OmpR family regulator
MAQVAAKGQREHSYAVDINRLRKKIDEQHPVKLIHTRRGEGYILGPR